MNQPDYKRIDEDIAKVEKEFEKLDRQVKENGVGSIDVKHLLGLTNIANTIYYEDLLVTDEEAKAAAGSLMAYTEQSHMLLANRLSIPRGPDEETLSRFETREMARDSKNVVEDLEKQLAESVPALGEKFTRKAHILNLFRKYSTLFGR